MPKTPGNPPTTGKLTEWGFASGLRDTGRYLPSYPPRLRPGAHYYHEPSWWRKGLGTLFAAFGEEVINVPAEAAICQVGDCPY